MTPWHAAKPWRGPEAFARAGFSPPGVIGLDMAFTPGPASSAVPVRSALLGAIFAVAAVVSAITFGANLQRLVSTPSLYGVTWDVGFDAQFSAVTLGQVVAIEHHLAGVTGVAGGTYGDDVTLDGAHRAGRRDRQLEGVALPDDLKGERPTGPGEVALGAGTMRTLGTRLGDWAPRVRILARGRYACGRRSGVPVFRARVVYPHGFGGEGAVTAADVVAKPPAGAGSDKSSRRYVLGPNPARCGPRRWPGSPIAPAAPPTNV